MMQIVKESWDNVVGVIIYFQQQILFFSKYSYNIDWSKIGADITSKKDLALVLAAAAAFIISLTTLIFTIMSKRADAESAAIKSFDEVVGELVDLRQKREELRNEMKEAWDRHDNTGLRVAINDKRELLLARAQYFLKKYKGSATNVSTTIIAAALSDLGRYQESLQYYEMAITLAPTEVSKAYGKRTYGRALVLAGRGSEGRAFIMEATNEFLNFSKQSAYDSQAMLFDRADAFRRLVSAQLAVGNKEAAATDVVLLRNAIENVADFKRRKTLNDASQEIELALTEEHNVFDDSMPPDDDKPSVQI